MHAFIFISVWSAALHVQNKPTERKNQEVNVDRWLEKHEKEKKSLCVGVVYSRMHNIFTRVPGSGHWSRTRSKLGECTYLKKNLGIICNIINLTRNVAGCTNTCLIFNKRIAIY